MVDVENKLVKEVYQYVDKICCSALENNKEIIIWGYGRCGKFFKHLIEEINCKCQVKYMIDDDLTRLCNGQVYVYRCSLFNYIENEKYILLMALKDGEDKYEYLREYGFVLNKNMFNVRSDIGESYLEYLEKRNPHIDFKVVPREECEEYTPMCTRHEAFGHSSSDRVFEHVAKLDKDIRFYDYGCGKGGALLYAYLHGIKTIGGCELVKHIYEQCVVNMKELSIDCQIENMNATKVNVDDYNCFFFFNPFKGEIFGKVIDNIICSYQRKPRKMYLIYANPFEHKQVIKSGFKLFEQVPIDCIDPLLNIYVYDENE